MSNLIHNERVKYRATFFNNAGILAFTTGGIFPILQGQPNVGFHIGALSIGGLVAAGFVAISQWMLSDLKE
jgi:hypothetical protein